MITLWQGDCLELMKDIPDQSVDCIICDLPYGTTACKWDVVIPFDKLWKEYERLIVDNGAIVLFGIEPFSSMLRTSNLALYRYDWVWVKNTNVNYPQAPYMPLKNTENIIVFSKGTIAQNSNNRMKYNPQGVIPSGKLVTGRVCQDAHRPNRSKQDDYVQKYTNYPKQILEFSKDSEFLHPTQKPVALIEYLVKTYTNENDTVLDNCLGSGTTGVACKNLNRNFIGIELDKDYFEIAKNRINNTHPQYKLF